MEFIKMAIDVKMSTVICPHCNADLTKDILKDIESSPIYEFFEQPNQDSEKIYQCPICEKEFKFLLIVYIRRWITNQED